MKNNLDVQNMLGSIDLLNQQCLDAWQAMKSIKLPASYHQINKVVLFGMGGSLLGMEVIKNLFADQLKVPVLIINDYFLPSYIDNNTLAILSSYSGGTEETVFAAQNILKKTKKVFVITTGGFLQKFAHQHRLPTYLINPRYNPCNQPRMALGYSLVGQMSVFNKLGLIKIQDADIKNLAFYLSQHARKNKELAKQQVKKIKNKVPIFVASEFLLGNVHIAANQTNENGKNMAAYFPLPELNHHLMEGLGNPRTNQKNLIFILINSHLYYPRNRKRYAITKKVLAKNKVAYLELKLSAHNKILQSFAVLQWGSYLSFYLSQANKIDPSPIPWVDFFKNELQK